MPSVGAPPASPYNIPVVGQNDVHHSGDYSDHKRPSLHFGDLADNFDDPGHLGLDDADDISPIMDGHHFGGGDDGGDGGFDFGPSPFKYHHDVSPGSGLKSDSFGFDDQVRGSKRRSALLQYFCATIKHNNCVTSFFCDVT